MRLKRICGLIFVVVALACTECGVLAKNGNNVTRDFTFGLINNFRAITPLSEDADGLENIVRFNEVRSEYPDEIPIFEPFNSDDYKHRVFVSPSGNDRSLGTIEKPLKTIEAAIKKIASLEDRSGGAVIYLREGIYSTDNSIIIPDTISGTPEIPTMISAYNGEKVVVSGGISVRGNELKIADDAVATKKLSDKVKGHVYSVDLTKLGYSLESLQDTYNWNLSADGTAYEVARWPNSETLRTAKYEGADAVNGMIDIGTVDSPSYPHYTKQNFGSDGFEFQILNTRPFSWENTGNIWLKGIFDVDWINDYYPIKSFNPDKKSVRTFKNTQYGAQYSVNHTYYYLNVLEELDIPGEWIIDNNTGMLYIYPMGDISNSTISFSSELENVIVFDKYSKNIVLSDISVESASGYAIMLQGYQNIVQKCSVSNVNSGISIDYGKNCGIISNNIVTDGFGKAIDLKCHVAKNIQGADEATLSPTRNFVQNNTVVGSIYTRGGVQNIVSHNEISNPLTMCLYVAEQVEGIFEYNEIVGGPWSTLDGGMIYVEGVSMTVGNLIRYNYLHDGTLKIRSTPYGIYLDNTAGRNYVYGNIVQECFINMHGGSDNVIYNNIILDEFGQFAIRNSENFWRNSMASTLDERFLNTLHYYEPQMRGKYKYYSEEWINRFPALYDSWEDLVKLRRKYKDVGKQKLMEAEEWDNFFGMKRTAYVNNVIYNAKDMAYPDFYKGETDAYYFNNKLYTLDDDIFEDYENKNYNIKSDSKVYRDIPDFEPLPRQERMGVIIADNLIANYADYIKMNPSIPTYINEKDFQLPYDLAFKWSKNPIATYYKFTLANDENFSDIVETAEMKQNYYILEKYLDFDTVYYWKVEAISEAQRFKDNTSVMETAMFKTGSYEEVASQEVLDYVAYEEKISEINSLLELLVEDDGTSSDIAVYKQGTKDIINSIIKDSKENVTKLKLNKEINDEATDVQIKVLKTLQDNLIPYTRTYDNINIDKFSMCVDGTGDLSKQQDAVKVKANENYCTIFDNRLIASNETISFNANFGNMDNWSAFGIKQIETDQKLITAAKGYYIIVKRDLIELQKYPIENSSAIKVAVQNDSKIISPNTWHKIDTKCELVENGLRIIVNVDEVNIFDWIDENPHYEFGYFSMMDNNKSTSDGIMIK